MFSVAVGIYVGLESFAGFLFVVYGKACYVIFKYYITKTANFHSIFHIEVVGEEYRTFLVTASDSLSL